MTPEDADSDVELSAAELRSVLDLLYDGLIWSDSKEGYDYWRAIARKIEAKLERTRT